MTSTHRSDEPDDARGAGDDVSGEDASEDGGAGAAGRVPDAVRIEQATIADADAIRRLDGLDEVSARLLVHDLARDDRRCLVARVGGEVVGYAAATCYLDEAEILDVAVASTWRRRGIATALLTRLDAELRRHGVSAITLEVRESNLGAQALYRHLGYAVEGRRPGYYRDGEAALIMWRWHGQES